MYGLKFKQNVHHMDAESGEYDWFPIKLSSLNIDFLIKQSSLNSLYSWS